MGLVGAVESGVAAWARGTGAAAAAAAVSACAPQAATPRLLCSLPTPAPPPAPPAQAYRLKKSRGDDPLAFISKEKAAKGEGGYDYV